MADTTTEFAYASPVVPATAGTVFRRISWGAVFAGLAVALVIQITLSVLGLGIGATIVNVSPNTANQSPQALGIGTIVWFVLTTFVSLYVGGCVAGRLAGQPRKQDAMLHGVVTWSAQTLVTFLLLTTAAGTVIGGMTGVLGRSLSVSNQDLSQIFPQASGGTSSAFEQMSGQQQRGAQQPEENQQSSESATAAGGSTSSGQGAQIAGNISTAAWWTFALLIIGAISAALGGITGRPKTVLVQTTT